ncbi:MAG: alkaline phosphatase family protein [Candidatus Eisenbacteria bacterium]
MFRWALASVVIAAAVLTLSHCGKPEGPPLVVIGLDGATWEKLDPWLEQGKLPNLKALRDRSAYGTLNSVMPYLSPPAWTSATTGVNPGRHGIFDFQRRLADSDKIVSETANSRRTQPIWNLLKGEGSRVCVINVPMTDPPDDVDGIMVSGFPHASGRKWVYPPERQSEIEAMGYLRDQMEMKLPGGEEQAVLDSLMLIQERRFELAKKLYQEEPWRLFWVVFTQTDRVQHLFWKFDDPESPNFDPAMAERFGGSIENLWVRCDELLGEFLALIPESTNILVLSDHGFGPIHREFRAGNFLRSSDSGFTQEEAVDVFSLDRSDAARLYVRQLGKDPGASRTSQQARELEARLAERFRSLVDPETGKSPFDRVDEKNTIFTGDQSEKGPNINLTPAPGYYVALGDQDEGYQLPTFGDPRSSLSGWHRMNGIVMIAGPNIKPGPIPANEQHSLLDVVPTALYLLDHSIPTDLYGKVISSGIDAGYWQAHPPVREGLVEPESRPLSPEEEAKIKNLPYVGG